jgi:hypothetical protein
MTAKYFHEIALWDISANLWRVYVLSISEALRPLWLILLSVMSSVLVQRTRYV